MPASGLHGSNRAHVKFAISKDEISFSRRVAVGMWRHAGVKIVLTSHGGDKFRKESKWSEANLRMGWGGGRTGMSHGKQEEIRTRAPKEKVGSSKETHQNMDTPGEL